MTRNTTVLCLWCSLCALALSGRSLALTANDFADFSLRDSNNTLLLPGRLYSPPAAASSLRPLVVFLHGGGANGTDNLAQLTHLTDGMVNEMESRGAFLYAPQTSNGWGTTARSQQVMTMIDRAIANLNADANRIYIMGYSNGGGGTWNMLSRYDGRFAAALTLSGVAPGSDFVASRLADTPLFTLHARDDTTVAVTTSRNVVNGILAAAHETLPMYPSTRDNVTNLFVSNPHVAAQAGLYSEAHAFGEMTDWLISNSTTDLMYIETGIFGHTGLYGVFDAPPVYDWMFSHSLAVPEPACASALLAGLGMLIGIRRRR
jgi:predicted peptidase